MGRAQQSLSPVTETLLRMTVSLVKPLSCIWVLQGKEVRSGERGPACPTATQLGDLWASVGSFSLAVGSRSCAQSRR